jgi:Cu/Ag efflux protein CusF
MKKMNLMRWLLPSLVLAVLGGNAWAQSEPAVTSNLTKVTATVKAIDPATRSVTLQGPKGDTTVQVGPEVKNFSNLKVGDVVNVSYYESVAAQIVKGSQKVTDPAASTFAYGSPKGMKPSGGAGASLTASVKIEAIDLGTNTVAFKGQDGQTHIIEVKSPNMRKFIRTLKPGDDVDVTYTQSVAVSVIPAS